MDSGCLKGAGRLIEVKRIEKHSLHGRSQDFSKGGHTESYRAYSPDCHLNIVGCLLTKRLTKGGSHAPQDPPGYAFALDFD